MLPTHLSSSKPLYTTTHTPLKMTSTTTTTLCAGRVAIYSVDCGFTPPYPYYMNGTQCDRKPDPTGNDACLCKLHNKNLPFGKFGKAAPDKTLTKCSVTGPEGKDTFKAGEPNCWLQVKPDGVFDADGNFHLITPSATLGNDKWGTEDETDYGEWESDEEDETDYSSDDSSGSTSSPGKYGKYSGIKVAELRDDLTQRGLATSGKKKDLAQRLLDHDSAPDADRKAAPKAKRPPTAYNLYMAKHLPDYKQQHPDENHKTAFKGVAALWAASPENPKNK